VYFDWNFGVWLFIFSIKFSMNGHFVGKNLVYIVEDEIALKLRLWMFHI